LNWFERREERISRTGKKISEIEMLIESLVRCEKLVKQMVESKQTGVLYFK
jgi:hypothetical protein